MEDIYHCVIHNLHLNEVINIARASKTTKHSTFLFGGGVVVCGLNHLIPLS